MSIHESIQGRIIKKICEQRITTPYYGLMSELGIWPVENYIEYKRIMLLHNIITTKEERLIKEIIEDQIGNTWKGCWMEQRKEICDKYKIELEDIKIYTKEKLKVIIKNNIKVKLEEEMDIRIKQKTKLRFIKNFERKTYLEAFDFSDSIEMIKIRLNMIETKSNYKGMFKQNIKCDVCKVENDTTEHLLECKETLQQIKVSVEDITQANININVVRQVKEVMEKRDKLGYKIRIGETEDSDDSEEEEVD